MCDPSSFFTTLERQIHHVGIDVARKGMEERFGESPHDLEPKALPKSHGPFVGAHDEIELHSPEASAFRVRERVCAHGPANPAAGSSGRRHIATVCDMAASSALIGTEVVCADHVAAFVGHEYVVML